VFQVLELGAAEALWPRHSSHRPRPSARLLLLLLLLLLGSINVGTRAF
jgi:hypothetical protein